MHPDWQTEDGSVRLYCADCLDVLPEMESGSVEVFVTSPPYNLVREWSGGGPNTSMAQLEQRFDRWYEDAMDEGEYQKWQRQCIDEMVRICSGSVFYNHKVRYAFKR